MKNKVIILGAGIGAMTIGFEKAGCKVVAAYEKDEKAIKLYETNIKGRIYRLKDFFNSNTEKLCDINILACDFSRDFSFKGAGKKEDNFGDAMNLILDYRIPVIFFLIPRRYLRLDCFKYLLKDLTNKGYRYKYNSISTEKATGLPIAETKIYLVAIIEPLENEFEFPDFGIKKEWLIEEILENTEVEDYYYDIKMNQVDEISKKDTFFCWKSKEHKYIETDLVSMNLIKIPLVRKERIIRKMTHRELARLRSLPDYYCLDIKNKDYMYKQLLYTPNVEIITQIARRIENVLNRNLQLEISIPAVFEKQLIEKEENDPCKERLANKEEVQMDGKLKKLFISHSEKDKAYVSAIVDLLVSMGLTQEEVFCSSIPGFGIGYGENIYKYLKDQFMNYDLHVLFILSNNYYKSAACLNEMGAAWVLQKKYDSILLPGFEFAEIDGAVNPRKKAMKLEGDSAELKNNLKQFIDDLTKEFGLREKSFAIWERCRDHLLDEINSIQRPIEENRQEIQQQLELKESFQLSTADEKILTYYILTKQVCNVEKIQVREWLIENEIYDVNIENGFTLLASLGNGKNREYRLTLDMNVFRAMMVQKDFLLSRCENVLNKHKYISANQFQKKWDIMRDCDKLLAAYISDERILKLMADSQIENIKIWENKRKTGGLLSNSYDKAIRFFVDNKFIYESGRTAYGSPKEYTVCKSLREFLWSGISKYTGNIEKIMWKQFS